MRLTSVPIMSALATNHVNAPLVSVNISFVFCLISLIISVFGSLNFLIIFFRRYAFLRLVRQHKKPPRATIYCLVKFGNAIYVYPMSFDISRYDVVYANVNKIVHPDIFLRSTDDTHCYVLAEASRSYNYGYAGGMTTVYFSRKLNLEGAIHVGGMPNVLGKNWIDGKAILTASAKKT